MDRAEELVSAHWDNYVGPLLTACGIEGQTYALCEFMYRSSGLHFYKHSTEDQREVSRMAMNDPNGGHWIPFQPHDTDGPVLNTAP